ncbi:MAG: hypothetical protein A2007_04580 [Verrucomicrobia bacterium GWC2_42_7]|nr:MAG: hypothetical protein A2007_04580 [Verrucomicrobia bacterium GWC2_42_7]
MRKPFCSGTERFSRFPKKSDRRGSKIYRFFFREGKNFLHYHAQPFRKAEEKHQFNWFCSIPINPLKNFSSGFRAGGQGEHISLHPQKDVSLSFREGGQAECKGAYLRT